MAARDLGRGPVDVRPLSTLEAADRLRAVPAGGVGQQLELPIFSGVPLGRHRPGPPVPGRLTLERMVTALLELCCGRRPRAQLRPFVRPDVFAKLTTTTARRYTLQTPIQACFPVAGVIETCGTVHGGVRSFAVAARFEATASGWWCVAFDLIGEPKVPKHRAG
ncbi:hypothetical protein GCM10027199_63980 [Amycolatopsis magusensis]